MRISAKTSLLFAVAALLPGLASAMGPATPTPTPATPTPATPIPTPTPATPTPTPTPPTPTPCTVDLDADGVCDTLDNCIPINQNGNSVNPAQDDTDGDFCGNVCDADVDQDGLVSFADIFICLNQFGFPNLDCDFTEPIGGGLIGYGDIFTMFAFFASPAGPSGTTTGTLACP